MVDAQTVQVTGADGKTTTQVVKEQMIAQGPVASQEAIKDFRHEWRRIFQRQQRASV